LAGQQLQSVDNALLGPLRGLHPRGRDRALDVPGPRGVGQAAVRRGAGRGHDPDGRVV